VRALVLGAGGQVGRALVAALPGAVALTRAEFDIAEADLTRPDISHPDWSAFDTIVNAAAHTDVDGAETPEGRVATWRANAQGPAALAAIARRHRLTLVHLSTEYVFDGRKAGPYTEDDPIAPLSAYGAAKAAGDLAVRGVERHYLLRPTWVVGDGRNFVRTMLGLAARGIEPSVVGDQIGRPTFATDIAAAIHRLVTSGAPYGTYHFTGDGEPASWADVARATYDLAGHPDLRVTETTTADYFADKPGAAPRPLNSVLDLAKAHDAGLISRPWRDGLADYVADALSVARS
jgi:dTDP-4-dehydrorhamnose 3,5-epimerase